MDRHRDRVYPLHPQILVIMREIPFKQWMMNLAIQHGRSVDAMYSRYYHWKKDRAGRYFDDRLFNVPMRQENSRVLYVYLP